MSDSYAAPVDDPTARKKRIDDPNAPALPDDPNAPKLPSDDLNAPIGDTGAPTGTDSTAQSSSTAHAPPPPDTTPVAAPAVMPDSQFASLIANNQANATGGTPLPADPSVDPFAAIGGGTYANGGWIPNTNQASTGYVAPTGVATGTAAPSTTPATLATGQPITATPAAVQSAYQQQLMNLLNPAPITADSIAENPASAAYRLQSQRGADAARQQAAERDAAEGTLGSGGFDSEVRGIAQQQAEGNSNFSGQSASHLYDQQQSQLQAAIASAQQSGQFQQAQALQAQLAQLQAQTQQSIAGGQLGYNYANLGANVNQQNNVLGLNYAQLEQQSNLQALLALLNGGA